MLYYEGLTCPVCHQAFTDHEDIVVCPQCGLPHHRSCWAIEGHCSEEHNHNTEHQWSRDKASSQEAKGHIPVDGKPVNPQICPHCYTRNVEFAEFCTHCGRPLQVEEWHSDSGRVVNEYSPFKAHNTGASINGVSEEDLSAVVTVNTQYYIPRFRRIRDTGNGGWNWAAFLLGPLWLIYRKQYLLGIAMFLFQTILDCATMWLTLPMNTANTEAEMLAAMTQIATNPMFFPAFALSVLLFATHVLLGLKGNNLYLYHCTSRINTARKKTPDISTAELGSLGGVSMGIVILFYLLSSFVINGFAALFLM